MRYSDIHPTFREAIGVHEGFRKLGFEASDIYVTLTEDGVMLLVLHVQDKEFVVGAGVVEMTRDAWIGEWTRIADAVLDNSVTDEDLEKIWTDSLPYQRPVEFALAIEGKGITLPVVAEARRKRLN